MSFLSRVAGTVRKALQPIYGNGPRGILSAVGLGDWYPGSWQNNDDLSQEDIMCSPIVYSCATLIANDIGKLRTQLVSYDDRAKIWTEVTGNSPFWPVLRRPNRYQNHVQFKQWWIMSKLRHGNTYALKERDERGIVRALYILNPAYVTPLVSDDGSVFYQLGNDNLAGIGAINVTVPASEIIHDRMNCLYHELVGIAPVHAAAIIAGIGVKIQRNSAYFFANNSRPSGILVAPGDVTAENARVIKEQWQSAYSGNNSGKVAVLASGMRFEAMATNATDAQMIETLRWTDERVASVFHVPAYKVGVGAMPSYNNVESLAQEYYNECLQSLIEGYGS